MLSYSEFGSTDAPALLIVHGLFGSGRNWGVIAKRLSDRFRVITVDMRNHGGSPHTKTHSYPEMAEDLAEVITRLGAPVRIVGHSMGGKAIMALGLSHSDMISSMIVADIAPATYEHSQLPFIHAMKAVDLTTVARRADAEAQLSLLGVEPALCSFFTQSLDVVNKCWRLNLETLEAEIDKIMAFPDLSGIFDKPVLFLTGARSDYVQQAHRAKIKSLFPVARFAKLNDAGHWLHADKPRAFEAAVRSFLQ
ncbi:MAG: alpha/beta fold hydrolase [Pseudomonadota bacterium]